MKDGADVINLYDKQNNGTNWVSLFIHKNAAVYFDSFVVKYILQEVLSKIKDRSITHNIVRVKGDDSIMCGSYFLIDRFHRIYSYRKNFVYKFILSE